MSLRTVALPDGRTLGYADWGPPDGRPVVYLHGALGSPLQRCPRTDALLQELGARYLLVQRPGFGASTPLPGRTLRGFARDVEAWADALAVDELLPLGVSAGGPYAAAVAHGLGPERAPAAAIVSGVGQLPATGPARAVLRADPARARRAIDGALRAMPAKRCGGGAAALLEDLRLVFGAWDFDPAEVEADVTLWHGTADPLVSLDHALALAITLPRCTPALAPGEGHFFFRRRMREVLEALLAAPARRPQRDERMACVTTSGPSHVGT